MLNFDITIDQFLKEKIPTLKLGCITADVTYSEDNKQLTEELEKIAVVIQKENQIEDIAKLDNIHHTREAYKVLGKKPSRYRPSAEALHRRIIRELGLYKVNNIVDITNLISLETGYSIGTYDLNKIGTKIIATIGVEGDTYKGIRKEDLNIHNLPVIADDKGKFGNPCSDSERAMIDKNTRGILMILWHFSGDYNLESATELASSYIEKYCIGKNLKTEIIK